MLAPVLARGGVARRRPGPEGAELGERARVGAPRRAGRNAFNTTAAPPSGPGRRARAAARRRSGAKILAEQMQKSRSSRSGTSTAASRCSRSRSRAALLTLANHRRSTGSRARSNEKPRGAGPERRRALIHSDQANLQGATGAGTRSRSWTPASTTRTRSSAARVPERQVVSGVV